MSSVDPFCDLGRPRDTFAVAGDRAIKLNKSSMTKFTMLINGEMLP